MRLPFVLPLLTRSRSLSVSTSQTRRLSSANGPIIRIEDGTFYRKFPSPAEGDAIANPPIFPHLSYSIPSETEIQQHWAVIGPSNAGKSTFLEILRGQHISLPPTARSYPYLSDANTDSRYRSPLRAVQYVGFSGERGGVGKAGTRGAYLSARYESRREDTDFSVMDYLRGDTDLNPLEEIDAGDINDQSLAKVVQDLKLEELIHMPMGNLSNGQTRRARIARALLGKPLLLLLDEPFMGLDPPTIEHLNTLLHNLAIVSSPRLLLALRPQDPLPSWITHLVHLGPDCRIEYQGIRNTVGKKASSGMTEEGTAYRWIPDVLYKPVRGLPYSLSRWRYVTEEESSLSRDGLAMHDVQSAEEAGEPVVTMNDISVKYGEKIALGGWKHVTNGVEKEGLQWTVRRGERWGVFGPNGSGKTTLLSLICSDHPQAYSLPIKMFGRNRLPKTGEPGISIFDIQARIGQSSPEIHAFFPRNISLRRVIENAWADTFLGSPRLTYENDITVDTCLRWFEAELNPDFKPLKQKNVKLAKRREELHTALSTDWADDIRFGDAPFSAQRVALFLRAIIKKPDLVVLDEAFSGMDNYVRDKCMLFMTHGETKMFAIGQLRVTRARPLGGRKRFVIDTDPWILSEKIIEGLSKEQALICVSHVKEEVPGVVRDWLSLPEASSGNPAKFGRLEGPLEGHKEAWEQIWLK